MRRAAPILVGLALALTCGTARAATPAEELSQAAARINAARQQLAAAKAPETRVGALTVAISAYQSALEVLRAGVGGANARERELSLSLDQRRIEIQHLIAALETMSRTPPPAQALHPGGPVGAARAAATLSHLTPILESEASDLATEYGDLAALRQLRLDGEQHIAAGLAALGDARSELGETLGRQAPPQPRGTEDPAMASMLRASDTLTALAGRLAESGGGGKATSAPPPALRRPVEGVIARAYEEPDAAGVRRPGIVMRAAPLALVSAPADAIVRYAGPFLDYGYVAVLEVDDATLVVLAGMAQLQVTTGQAVRVGALLGLLGGPAFEGDVAVAVPSSDPGGAETDGPSADESGDGGVDETGETDATMDAAGGSGAGEMLYMEVRHGQGPVNPAELFVSENG